MGRKGKKDEDRVERKEKMELEYGQNRVTGSVDEKENDKGEEDLNRQRMGSEKRQRERRGHR